MKEQAHRIFRNFDLGAFLSVAMLMTGAALFVLSILASLVQSAWTPLWLLVPAILSFATAAGVTL